jgi:molecular chaperone GrpE
MQEKQEEWQMRQDREQTQLTLPEIEASSEAAGATASDSLTAESSEDDLISRLYRAEDQGKRASAELQNYRRRSSRELERLLTSQKEAVLRDWLEVVDNMERALETEGSESNPWYRGVKAIYLQMMDLLKRYNVEPMRSEGEIFDPRRHEAVAITRSQSHEEGVVAEVLQTGYTIDDKVLREARVVIVKNDAAG